MRTSNEKM